MDSTITNNDAEPTLGELVAYFDWRFYAQVIALFVLFVALFAVIQYASPDIVGNDGYYHLRMADIMRREGLTPAFNWLPLTILDAAHYYDHHMLYHVGLALFVPGDPRKPVPDEVLFTAAKWASIVFPALAFIAIWHLLRRQGVRGAWLWALALFAISDAFLYRMSMVRAQALSLMLLALGTHWLLRRRYERLLPLGFIYVWTYNAFPLLMIVAVAVFIATWIAEHKLEWWALIFPLGGISLGLLVNPYFPQDLIFFVRHVAPKFGENTFGLGVEWEPYNTWVLVENSFGMFVILALSMLALGWHNKRLDRSTLAAMGLMFAFGLLLLKSRRFVEYAPAFVLIFAALSIRPIIDRWWVGKDTLHIALAAGGVLLIMIPLMVNAMMRARDAVATSKSAEYMADGVHWLKENAPPGSMIFQTDWDDFTRLFFYDPDAVFTAGLDPTFFQIAHPALYDEWVDITQGRVPHPSDKIRDDFGGQYVFSDRLHTSFINIAKDDPGLTEVYRDGDVVIWQVVNP